MNLRTSVHLALSRLVAAPTRPLLTMLGVIIGVAALLALTSIASGGAQQPKTPRTPISHQSIHEGRLWRELAVAARSLVRI